MSDESANDIKYVTFGAKYCSQNKINWGWDQLASLVEIGPNLPHQPILG